MNSRITHAVSRFITRYPVQIVVLSLLFTLALGKGAGNLTFSNDYRDYFSEENPQLLEWERLQEVFGKTDNVLLSVTDTSGSVFNHETLAALVTITDTAWQIPYAKRVDSLSNFQHVEPIGDDDIHVGDLIDQPEHLSDADIDRIRSIALTHPQLVHFLINDEGSTTAINVEVLLSEHPREQITEISLHAYQLKAELAQRYPHLQFHISGSVLYNYAMTSATKQDMSTLMPGMFLLILILFGAMTRNVSTAAATGILMIFSVIGTTGLAGWFGIVLMAPSLSAPTIVMTLAVANAVHLMVTFFSFYVGDTKKSEAVEHTVEVNLTPVLVTNLTTAIGFLSMNFSDVPPYRDLGNMVAAGILIVVIFSVFLLPALLAILPVRPRKGVARSDARYLGLSRWVQRYPGIIVGGFTLTLVFSIVGISRLTLNDRFIEWMDDRYEFRRDSDFINDSLTGLYRLDWGLESGQENGITTPAYLASLDALTEWARTQPGVVHVQSMTDVFKELNQKFHGGNPDYFQIPDSQELASQLLLIYELSLPMGRDLNNMINVSKSSSRFVVRTANLSTNELLALEQRTNDWIRENGVSITQSEAGSTSILFANISERNIRSMLVGTLAALIMISFILIAPLRSLKLGLLSLVPNLLPIAVAFGVWGLLVSEVGLAISVVIGMTMGIVVDDTVHFMIKYLRKRREGFTAAQSLDDTFVKVGPALTGTTVILALGFLLLAQSGFEVNQQMGALTSLVIVIAWIADLLLLPSLLFLLDRARLAVPQPEPVADESDGDAEKSSYLLPSHNR